MSLQKYPSDASAALLRGLLGSSELDLRGQAAVSLSHLGDASGAHVLVELLDPAAYERARAAQPHKFARATEISQTRRTALEALLRLGDPEHRARIEQISRTDADLALREAAILALAGAHSR
jgi:HEAT repeat protein